MKNENKDQIGWCFDNSYARLPKMFFAKVNPEKSPNARMIILNHDLAKGLGLNEILLESMEGVEVLAGNQIVDGAMPLAQAYAGHQFGHFTKLGDGRAILLGEHITPDQNHIDIQLKGTGRTPYSRNGDGKATLGPMLREYIISEAMYALGIPTTRSLAVVTTGELVQREVLQQGAILTRVAASHLRVGTFEYAAKWGNEDDLKHLADYAIQRHFPNLLQESKPYLELLKAVVAKQAVLVAKWNLVGFIHGVMNTDNITISGETIDYGPCAFMDTYAIDTVFSSIDHQGRYAYGNQAPIMGWNMARFAETLLPLIDKDRDIAISEAQQVVSEFGSIYHKYWLEGMGYKLGIFNIQQEDKSLVYRLLELMQEYKADYTNVFKALTLEKLEEEVLFEQHDFKEWHALWQKRLELQDYSKVHVKALMQQNNPAVIPRNYLVEQALKDATFYDKESTMRQLLEILQEPYAYSLEQEAYSKIPNSLSRGYRTYCGT